MSTPPLTEAEQAAAAALAFDLDIPADIGVEGFRKAARAVVAAVRPLIAEEALRQTADYLYEHRRDSDGAYDLWRMYEAGGPEWLSSRAIAARQSTARPTSKEQQ